MTTKRRPALGSDPLDALFSSPAPGVSSPQKPARAARAPKPAPAAKPAALAPVRPPVRGRKVKATYVLPPELVEEARDAAVALAGPPVRLTLAALVEGALRRELDRLRVEHHHGKPFPRHGAPLVGGRPIRG